ncbi:LacI family DNA-binding transcriptional regulator [Marinitenerispora sediminis]|uniref:LacI family transcriptional regulator n=1 Tax=Marinitenerispora sediminis TaxID=1931232 RepID=A0A368T6S6_9ACTN|nr:LacI family DNA-binding transcriptional regulator [Marinitenerispora sediminis]RCV52539.1 LacI family transcriptional regulator [Marinitenerispora sediminis]RCV59498.1 LacI family transcriptional regulator [Marinitenerispora sediminis]RCV59605.1 LacI family transcriptional regulator [Marinitenerispora sediminis]
MSQPPEQPRAATLESVAEAAAVSRQTVSNVLNAPHRVRAATREKVEAAIRELGYQPNRLARSLRTRASRMLGYCVQPHGDGNVLLDRFLHAITEAAAERGYHVLLFSARPGAEGLPAYADLLAQRTVDGFVLSDTFMDDPRQEWLAERDVPFAAFGRSWSEPEHGSWIDVDGAAGTRDAVDHLYEQGHRRIGFVGWGPGSGVGDDRRAGWERACAAHGLGPQPSTAADNDLREGAAAARRLLDLPDPPTALVCVSDMIAIGCLGVLAERGLRPGRDVAVVGFDDLPAAALPGIDLTTLSQPLDEIGRGVVDLVLDQLGDSAPAPDRPRHRVLRPSLVVRSSSIPFPRAQEARTP